MKKLLILACSALLFATSCLTGGVIPGGSATYSGSVVVTDTSTGEVTYSNKEAYITVTIPNQEESKFNIVFNKMKFAEAMPKLDVEVPDVPFTPTVSQDETTINHTFDVCNIVPTVGGVKYQKYKIDRIWGCIGKKIDIEFEMLSKQNKVHFTNVKPDEESTPENQN